MKILIAYDGSKCSDAALDDLVRAGLPAGGSALVLSVSEMWLPPRESEGAAARKPVADRSAETEALAAHGPTRVRQLLPGWDIKTAVGCGSPASQILSRADEFAPDLIVMGAQGRSSVGRFALGSISQKVLTEARCSVRIGRGRIEVDEAPMRVMIGFDGSQGSFEAVKSVARRRWPAGTEIRILSLAEPAVPSSIDRFVTPSAGTHEGVKTDVSAWLEESARTALTMLGVPASFEIMPGDPRSVLAAEAARWNADCIFLGAGCSRNGEPAPLGSTAAAVAARAASSVEVVRV